MARVFSPRNVLLLVTIYLVENIKCEEHCETRDLRVLVKHVRQLETEFKSLTDSTFKELKELKSTMMEELCELRNKILQNSTCPEGWERNGCSCYYIEERNLSFDDAQEFCKSRSANLVHVNDTKENDFLKSLMEKSGRNWFWIGMKYNVSEWRWIDDGTVAGFTDWAPGKPDGGGAHECCRAFSGESYRWNDVPCSETKSPLCEKVLS